MPYMLQTMLSFVSMSLGRLSARSARVRVWHSPVNHQLASQLTRLIRAPVKRLFLRDTSSSALALGVSRPTGTRRSIHAPDRTGAGNMEFQMSILHAADSVAVSKPIHAYANGTDWGRCWRDSAILQKDFALGNQTKSLK